MKTNNVTMSYGKPITSPYLVPVTHRSTPTCINRPFMVDGMSYNVTAMSFGSPHGAVIVDDLNSIDVSQVGEALGTHALFPKGANVVFIQILDNKTIEMRLWQQNGEESTFTGEAACVAGTASMMLQQVLHSEVSVRNGDMEYFVKWDRGGGHVYLTGSSDLINTNKACTVEQLNKAS